MSITSQSRARDFIANETQFHLGFLPTEQSNPQTRDLDKEFARSTVDGIANLQQVDRNVLEMAKKVLQSSQFKKLCAYYYFLQEICLYKIRQIAMCSYSHQVSFRMGDALLSDLPETNQQEWLFRQYH